MPMYRVFINRRDSGQYVTAINPQDAYADVAAEVPLAFDDRVQLQEMGPHDARPRCPARNEIPMGKE